MSPKPTAIPTDRTLHQLLSVSPGDLEVFRENTNALFLHPFLLLGMAWHEDYLATGPDIQHIATAWERLFGRPWIHITDAMWVDLPRKLQRQLVPDFFVDPRSKPAVLRKNLPMFFPLYVHLAHKVQPRSEEALTLAWFIQSVGAGHSLHDSASPQPVVEYAQLVRDGHLDGLIQHLLSGENFAGFAENPLISAPECVVACAQSLNLSEDAACYFLQLLAVSNPTDTHVLRWNNWRAEQLAQARDELVAKNLVVVGQREHSNRSVFLAGGWLKQGKSRPAMERWKAPHYLHKTGDMYRPIILTCPPHIPYSELFAAVWARYMASGIPH